MSEACDGVLPWIKPGWVGVEIGTAGGDSALALLEHGARFLYLIDPWEGQDWWNAHAVLLKKLEKHQDRFAMLRMQSDQAAPFIPMVDFVWVDGDHRYENVASDLAYYWKKVRVGGVMCGHDYTGGASEGVKRAVDEFARDRARKVYTRQSPYVHEYILCWIIPKVI